MKTGWPLVDDHLPGGGLSHGALHEWIGTVETSEPSIREVEGVFDTREGEVDAREGASDAWERKSDSPERFSDLRKRAFEIREANPPRRRIQACPPETAHRAAGHPRAWRPPLGLMIHLAHQAHLAASDREIVWIGAAVWPYPPALGGRGVSLLNRSLFLRAPRVAERVSAACLVLRSRAVAATIVDGSGFDLNATRRLSLAVEAGGGLCLLVRPPWERACLSAARTRWLVRPRSCGLSRFRQEASPRWIVELLRCKGVQPTGSGGFASWSLERDRATRAIVMASDVGDGPGLAAHRSSNPCAG